MALKDEGSSITINKTRVMTGPAVTGNNISPTKEAYVPLKPTKTLLGFSRLSGLYPNRSKVGR